jgi:hypothetical protein
VFTYLENPTEQIEIYSLTETNQFLSGKVGSLLDRTETRFDFYIEYTVVTMLENPDANLPYYSLTCYFIDGALAQYSIVFRYEN